LTADVQQARPYAEEWLQLARELDDAGGLAAALTAAGIVEVRAENAAAARLFLLEALEVSRAGGLEIGWAYALVNLGEADSIAHEYQSAERHFAQAEILLARAGVWASVAVCRRGIAWAHLMRDDAARAATLLREAMDLTADTQSRGGMVICLDMVALLACEDDPELAARLLGAGDDVVASIGSFLRGRDETAERATAAIDAALGPRGMDLRAEGRVLGLEGAVPLARAYVDSR
jgi:tetratricopeptide (TPR) repeat protein